jgi:hypothetical protein
MKTKLATAFGLAMLSVAFSFSTSFACPETSQTAASAVESTISESGMNVTTAAEVSAPEGQFGEVGAPASVASNIEAPSTEASGPSTANAIPVEITVTATVVVPGQNSEDQEGPAMPAGIAGTEPSLTEVFSQAAAPESEAKATADPSAQTGAAEAQIEVAEPAATVVAIEPPSTDVTAPPATVSVDAVPVEINVTVTVVVPGQQPSEAIDEVEITGPQPEHPISAPSLKRDEATAALDNEE